MTKGRVAGFPRHAVTPQVITNSGTPDDEGHALAMRALSYGDFVGKLLSDKKSDL
jgi:hypothetical protein